MARSSSSRTSTAARRSLTGARSRPEQVHAARRTTTPPPATTGACAPGDVGYGVRAQGVELEASLVPARDFRVDARPDLSPTPISRQSGRQRRRRAAQPGAAQAAGPDTVERAGDRRDRLGGVDARHRQQRPFGAVLCRWAPDRATTTPGPTCSRRRRRTASRCSTRASASAARTSAGRSSSGARTSSTSTMPRSRSTRRSRKARHRRRVPGSAVSGRSPAVLAVPRRAADLRHHAARSSSDRRRAPRGPARRWAGRPFSMPAAATARSHSPRVMDARETAGLRVVPFRLGDHLDPRRAQLGRSARRSR